MIIWSIVSAELRQLPLLDMAAIAEGCIEDNAGESN